MEVPVVKTNFHGKKVRTTETKKVNKKKSLKGDKKASEYFSSVRAHIIKNSKTSTKAKKLKLKGKVLAKIQIQSNGSYDILFVGGDHPELVKMTNDTFSRISGFMPIPSELEQKEIQLKIPLHYNLNNRPSKKVK